MANDGLSIFADDGGGTLLLRGEADFSTLEQLRFHLRRVEDVGGDVVIDLTGVDHFDSTALGAFIGTHRRLNKLGGRLVLRNPSSAVMRVLEVTGLQQFFEVEPAGPGQAES